ncbi:hypothetical protein Dda_5885 [Drechslerella dactyloides]|uniref:RIC1 C-terminal alpha solenoid region domain-containing protein n=1 Tax=Drechslerella dactyloides TaxID=74499 RepID=A0AAD6IWQ7_DREDA|nr:hypothetical protein Dda_5885 [Drechslerella dactyloides]
MEIVAWRQEYAVRGRRGGANGLGDAGPGSVAPWEDDNPQLGEDQQKQFVSSKNMEWAGWDRISMVYIGFKVFRRDADGSLRDMLEAHLRSWIEEAAVSRITQAGRERLSMAMVIVKLAMSMDGEEDGNDVGGVRLRLRYSLPACRDTRTTLGQHSTRTSTSTSSPLSRYDYAHHRHIADGLGRTMLPSDQTMYWPLNVPRVYTSKLPQHALDDFARDTVPSSPLAFATDIPRAADGATPSASDDIGEPYVGDTLPNILESVPEHVAETTDEDIQPPETTEKEPLIDDGDDEPVLVERFDKFSTGDSDGHADPASLPSRDVLAVKISRSGHLFATITAAELAVWQTRPTAVVAQVLRSNSSLKLYGENVDLMIRPDSQVFVVQTSEGYLITYTLQSDPSSKVYKQTFPNKSHAQNVMGNHSSLLGGVMDGGGVKEFMIRFRMPSGIYGTQWFSNADSVARALAWDDELVVATLRPPAIQCIRWTPDASSGQQTSTELLSRMNWIQGKKVTVSEMVHDRPMNLSTWVTSDGKAYAVQRLPYSVSPLYISWKLGSKLMVTKEVEATGRLFKGYCFHQPSSEDLMATKAAINARFSLIAAGMTGGQIHVYNARDYVGNIPLSHIITPPASKWTSGKLTFLAWSPDGYALFAGFEAGWALWTTYGKLIGSTYSADNVEKERFNDAYLDGLLDGAWLPGGVEIALVSGKKMPDETIQRSPNIYIMELARSSVTGLFNATPSKLLVYRGYDQSDLQTLSTEQTLWHHVPIPPTYLVDNYPIRQVAISPDGRYIAIAGRRGLAHYSIHSGRWKTFVNDTMENDFVVRGGMCWYHHILVAAVESDDMYELRLYSRELQLDNTLMLHVETLPSPVVLITLTGDDGLLAYTHDNVLYHFIFTTTKDTVLLRLVGQITFHGIVRAPARVRSISWVLPEEQLHEGDPSRDVALATVLFLVDGKLVVLQPSTTEGGELKYEMRVLFQNVEYYMLMRDLPTSQRQYVMSPDELNGFPPQDLNDSLWVFEGQDLRVWMDVKELLAGSVESKELPPAVKVPVDFYPLSILLSKGIISGVEIEIVERRDVAFSFFRLASRTHLFFNYLLRHHLQNRDEAAAIGLAKQYENVSYFEHALEILLHDVLDDEADTQPEQEVAVLPLVIRFLSNFPEYLNVIVQCTRKTEVASWSHLFSVVGSPQVLFEESLSRGLLKTAGGYLLILHTMEKLSSSSQDMVRLFSRAVAEEDWDLCKELARFLTALDNSGKTLKEALELVQLRSPGGDEEKSFMFESARRLDLPGSGGSRENLGALAAGVSPRGESPKSFLELPRKERGDESAPSLSLPLDPIALSIYRVYDFLFLVVLTILHPLRFFCCWQLDLCFDQPPSLCNSLLLLPSEQRCRGVDLESETPRRVPFRVLLRYQLWVDLEKDMRERGAKVCAINDSVAGGFGNINVLAAAAVQLDRFDIREVRQADG